MTQNPLAAAPRILCVEDNPNARAIVRTMVEAFGHRVDCAASGDEAVAAVAAGAYAAVLMDVTLPGMDGMEATRRIRALPAPAGATPVIGLSGHAGAAAAAAARAAGMDAYLVKPVTAARLAAALRTVAAAGSPG